MLEKKNSDSLMSEYPFDQIPFQDVVHFGQRSLLNRDLFVVSWLLGRYCNYRCSYCWPYAHSHEKDHRPLDLLRRNLNEIKRQARERGFNSFHFSFSGGEPTAHPQYLELLKHYADDTPNCRYQSVHMTSNCSPPMRWFEAYANATLPLHRVSVTASFHKEFAKRESFRDKLVFLQSRDVQVTINMVMAPERFEVLWDDALFFHESGINVTLKPQSNISAQAVVDGYTPEQLRLLRMGLPQRDYTRARLNANEKSSMRPKAAWNVQDDRNAPSPTAGVPANLQVELRDANDRRWFIDQAERFNAFGFNRFRGWECSAGYRSIVIREPDGVIKRSYSCHDRPLGTLTEGFQLFDKVEPCTTESCVSSADSKIPKRKPGIERPLWGAGEN